MPKPIVDVRDLHVAFETHEGRFSALNAVDLAINEGEIIALVGESGCGKTTLALTLIGLLPKPPAKILSGEIWFKGQNLATFSDKQMEKVRGTGISMIFQEPLTSLDPLFTVGDQLKEAIRVRMNRIDKKEPGGADGRLKVSASNLRDEAIKWLKKVELPDPENSMDYHPHELSGGMRQRIMIAMALAEQPALILADEPTSALDVTIQAQILKLMHSLTNELHTSVLFISHDLTVVAQIAERVGVMYTGIIVEDAPINEIFENPLHPYTQALIKSLPSEGRQKHHLETIPGSVPSLTTLPTNCAFSSRCKYVTEKCKTNLPKLKEVSPRHRVACFLY